MTKKSMRIDSEENLELRPMEVEIHKGCFESPEKSREMRRHLSACAEGLLSGTMQLCIPRPQNEWVFRGEGLFHLAPELFIQTEGATVFSFPHEELVLKAGQALIVPARFLHAESVSHATRADRFENVVVYADGASLICHLAHEKEVGVPDINYLEAGSHKHAARVQDWLDDAVQVAWESNTQENGMPGKVSSSEMTWKNDIQARALTAAACAGVLKVLDESARKGEPEPPLIARVRAWVFNRISDHDLSVAFLAKQAGCSMAYLSHLFSQTTGEHLMTYINRERMRRAMHLLAETEMSGKEVAWACGYSAPSYFVRTFKMHYGVTPMKWRARHCSAFPNDR